MLSSSPATFSCSAKCIPGMQWRIWMRSWSLERSKNIIRNGLRHAQRTVKVTLRQDQQSTSFTVEDDGPGIPAEQRAAIFEPFYRIDNSRQRESGGHGLGLAIVQRICDWTDAEISVEDSPLGGALFRLRWKSSAVAVPGAVTDYDRR